jgi:peptidylprolyl isomerase
VRRLLILLALLAALALAACGDDDDDGDSASTSEAPAETQPAAPEEPGVSGDLKDTSVKPEIPKPEGEPPAKLVKEDIVVGKGKAAKPGDALTMQYVGVSHSTGEQFDASWDAGQPFQFQLGAGMVIPGWDQGIEGMKVGGRRKLTIPPDLAYGAQGFPPAIGPNETLVFVVDVVQID